MNPSKHALISVSDKHGLIELAGALTTHGYAIVSTGGTARFLRENGFTVTGVSDITGFPEIMDGRVKTLHPKIHGGILCDRSKSDHLEAMTLHGIIPFDIVVVNLYPFQDVVQKQPGDTHAIIENIDIGGPCLLRAAAKNHAHCLVVPDPADYPRIIEMLNNGTLEDAEMRRRFAWKAFSLTGRYDAMIRNWFEKQMPWTETLPETLSIILEKDETLRYGENPHQDAAVYRTPLQDPSGLLGYTQHSGKELSYNNMLDLKAAWDMATFFSIPTAVVIKHQNPCGAAVSEHLADAAENALAGDPMSAFGGIVACNRPVDIETARVLHATRFLEVVAAPGFTGEALDMLRTKKNRRLISLRASTAERAWWDIRLMHNGALIQSPDSRQDSREGFHVVTRRAPTEAEWSDLLFGWDTCRFVKSNAIVFARRRMVVGVGAGQMSRVDSVRIAGAKAGERAQGGIMASDAFFPFRDGIDAASEAGIRAVIQPGGSKGDESVIDACNELDIAMVFTGIRHFRH
ncbi:MAG TPA: bifunctional phosphoribosylaminoimidazolecarboxamide formyltransferase/IMP cyclohydrolase [bacterium]|nr:bifunctional phosphoribosylaminoimidazolecarboxamide formyltransferase/IMP cyclohydrolase [bacterium]